MDVHGRGRLVEKMCDGHCAGEGEGEGEGMGRGVGEAVCTAGGEAVCTAGDEAGCPLERMCVIAPSNTGCAERSAVGKLIRVRLLVLIRVSVPRRARSFASSKAAGRFVFTVRGPSLWRSRSSSEKADAPGLASLT